MQFRETYQKVSQETDREVLERYGKVGLLVLDDFGTQNTSDWAFTMLYMLINRRYDDMSPTIITSNYSLEELADKLEDDRITSRLYEMCDVIHNTKQYRHT
jgi:DNA replication protein DnaC